MWSYCAVVFLFIPPLDSLGCPISRCVVSELLFSGYSSYLIDWASWFVYIFDIAPVTNTIKYIYIYKYIV
jgi:hypothetical protein